MLTWREDWADCCMGLRVGKKSGDGGHTRLGEGRVLVRKNGRKVPCPAVRTTSATYPDTSRRAVADHGPPPAISSVYHIKYSDRDRMASICIT